MSATKHDIWNISERDWGPEHQHDICSETCRLHGKSLIKASEFLLSLKEKKIKGVKVGTEEPKEG